MEISVEDLIKSKGRFNKISENKSNKIKPFY